MTHCSNDRFLGEFLNDTEHLGMVLFPEENDLENCEDLFNLSNADDDSLVSYLSGQMHPSLTSNSSESSNVSENRQNSVHEGIQSQVPTDQDVIIVPDEHELSMTSDTENQDIHIYSTGKKYAKRHNVAKSSDNARCNTKGAIAARERRKRAKLHLEGLEMSVEKLTEENKRLKRQDAEKNHRIVQLQDEVEYLKNIVANNSTLSSLLKNIQCSEGSKLVCSFRTLTSDVDKDVVKGASSACGESSGGDKEVIDLCEDSPVVTNSQNVPPSSKSGKCSSEYQQMKDSIYNFVVDESTSDNVLAVLGVQEKTSRSKKVQRERQVPDLEADIIDCTADGNAISTASASSGAGGICLHVLGDTVSIEFCASCNQNAVKTLRSNALHLINGF